MATDLPAEARQPVVTELMNFITTPRCTQAMVRGTIRFNEMRSDQVSEADWWTRLIAR